jgi:hypothetical protein
MKPRHSITTQINKVIQDVRGDYPDKLLRNYALNVIDCALRQANEYEATLISRIYYCEKSARSRVKGLRLGWHSDTSIILDVAFPLEAYAPVPLLEYEDDGVIKEIKFPTGDDLIKAFNLEYKRIYGG